MTQPMRIGPYEAGEFVAGDAHASVCRVVDPDDGRVLTAKMYAPTGGPDAQLLSRWHDEFTDEARRLKRHGRDLAPIEASGRAGDMAWVVMDIPSGEFLESILGEQPIATDRARAILGAMAAALDRLHANGLVHRSLKPSNVIITDDGSICFIDTLLLGRFAEAVIAGALSLDRVTCAAPEVVLGYRQGPASNQYSLAVLAYRALTGAWPYSAGNAIDYAYACVYQEASAPSSRLAGISPQVDAVIARGLAKEPDDRYSTCTEFFRELDAGLQECEEATDEERAGSVPVPEPDPIPDPVLDESPVLEWFESPTTVLELVPEPLSEPPPLLRAVRELAPQPEPHAAPPEAAPEVAVPEEVPDPSGAAESRAAAEPGDLHDTAESDEADEQPEADELPEVVVPGPQEIEEFVAHPSGLRPRSSMRQRLHRFREGALHRLRRFTTSGGGRRVPDHLMREAYLADWRGDAARSNSGAQEWSDPITPEWTLTVRPAKAGWLRVDGRYAGPAPAEISILGRSGKRVLVELMRDGVAVATTELQLHPLMPKIWEPQED